jgi:hypothetical protein
MPARPFVANVIKVALGGLIGSHNFAIILHSQYSGTVPTAAQLNTLAGDINTAWGASYKAEVSSAVVMNSVVITDLSSATGAQGVNSTAQTGTNAGGQIVGNSAVLCNYPSSIRYRGGHPRSYLPGPPDGSLATPSTITTGYQTALTTAWNAVLAPLFGTSIGTFTTAGQCAVSYVTALAPRVTPLVMPISQNAITIEINLASQRRRIGRK